VIAVVLVGAFYGAKEFGQPRKRSDRRCEGTSAFGQTLDFRHKQPPRAKLVSRSLFSS